MIPLSQRIKAWGKTRGEPAPAQAAQLSETSLAGITKIASPSVRPQPTANKIDSFDMTALKDVVYELDTSEKAPTSFSPNAGPKLSGIITSEISKHNKSGISSKSNNGHDSVDGFMKPIPDTSFGQAHSLQHSGLQKSQWARAGTVTAFQPSESVTSSTKSDSASMHSVSLESTVIKTERATLTPELLIQSRFEEPASEAELVAQSQVFSTAGPTSKKSPQAESRLDLGTLPHLVNAPELSIALKKSVNPVNEAIKTWTMKKKNPIDTDLSCAASTQQQSEILLEQARPGFETSYKDPDSPLAKDLFVASTLHAVSSTALLSPDQFKHTGMATEQQESGSYQKRKRQKTTFGVPRPKTKAPVVALFQIPDSTKAFSKSKKTVSEMDTMHLGQLQNLPANECDPAKTESEGQDSKKEQKEADLPKAEPLTAMPTSEAGNVSVSPKKATKSLLADTIRSWSSTRKAPSSVDREQRKDVGSSATAYTAQPAHTIDSKWDQRAERRLNFLSQEVAKQQVAQARKLLHHSGKELRTEPEASDDSYPPTPASDLGPMTPEIKQGHIPNTPQMISISDLQSSHTDTLPELLSTPKPKSRASNLLAKKISAWSKKSQMSPLASRQLTKGPSPYSIEKEERQAFAISPSPSKSLNLSHSPMSSHNASPSTEPHSSNISASSSSAKVALYTGAKRLANSKDETTEFDEPIQGQPTAMIVQEPTSVDRRLVEPHDMNEHLTLEQSRTKAENRTSQRKLDVNQNKTEHFDADYLSEEPPLSAFRSLNFSIGPSHETDATASCGLRHVATEGSSADLNSSTIEDSGIKPNASSNECITTPFNKSLRANAVSFTPSRTVSVTSNDTEYQHMLFKGPSSARTISDVNESNDIEQLRHQVQYLTDRIEQMAIGISSSPLVGTQKIGEHHPRHLSNYDADKEHLQTKVESLVELESSKVFSQALVLQSRLEAMLQVKIEAAVELETSKAVTAVTNRLEHMLKVQGLNYNTRVSTRQLELEASLEAKLSKEMTRQATLQLLEVEALVKRELLKVPALYSLQPSQIEALILEEVSKTCKSPAMLQSLEELLASRIPKETPAPAALQTSQTSGRDGPAYTEGINCWFCYEEFPKPSGMALHLKSHISGGFENHARNCNGPCRYFGQDSQDFPMACPGCDRVYGTVTALFDHLNSEKKYCVESFHDGTGHVWGLMGQLRRRLRIDEAYMYGRKI